MNRPATDTTAPIRIPRISHALRVVAGAILVLILGVTVVQLLQQRAAAIDDTRQELTRLDMVFAEQTGRAIETIDIVMRDVGEQLRALPGGAPAVWSEWSERLQRRIAGLRQLSGMAITGADGRIYAIGGFDSTSNATVEAYDTTTNVWTTVAPMPTARYGLAAATGPDGRIYAIGGVDGGSNILATVEAYDTTTNVWTAVAPMPTPRYHLAAATGPDGRIYAIGGTNLAPHGGGSPALA